MGILVDEEGNVSNISPRDGRFYELDELQHYCGGYIEPLYLKQGRVALVNEDGALLGLDLNYEATLRV